MKALSLVSGNRGLALLGVGWLLACCMTVLLVDDNGGETILLGGDAVVSVLVQWLNVLAFALVEVAVWAYNTVILT
jgi:hypothetical protein